MLNLGLPRSPMVVISTCGCGLAAALGPLPGEVDDETVLAQRSSICREPRTKGGRRT